MSDIYKTLVFADDESDNWLFKKYYYGGANSRYWTFQIVLNILAQRGRDTIIVETGCQRMADDLGAGMSTSIFGEFCKRHGGKLMTVDLMPHHLMICRECTKAFADHIEYIESDGAAWLGQSHGFVADLIYLDSLDYPIGDQAGDLQMQRDSQEQCILEFEAAVASGLIGNRTLILIDDNQLPGGGKPKMLKARLASEGWKCLMDLQQSLWCRSI